MKPTGIFVYGSGFVNPPEWFHFRGCLSET